MSLLDESTRQLLEDIVTKNFRPPQVSIGIASARDERSRRSRSQSVETQSWPSDWALDKPSLRAALNKLQKGTHALRLLQEPPSTEAMPNTLPSANTSPVPTPVWSTASSPSGSTRNPSDTASTRQMSADKAIYSHPIGPTNKIDLNNPQIQAVIAAVATAAVAQYVQDNPSQQGPPGQQDPPGNDGLDGTFLRQPRWNPGNVGFFHPMYEDKSVASGASPMEYTTKETYFCDVHFFLEHARDVAGVKGDDLVCTYLWTCLKGPALDWWLTELTENDKRLAKLGNRLEEWERMLIERFKAPTNIAIDSLLKEKYTLRDASNHREPREYAQKILRAAKDAKFVDVRNQLDVIYNGVDSELRRDL